MGMAPHVNGGDLAKLSFDAAVEIDKLLHGEAIDPTVIRGFVESLRAGMGGGLEADISSLHADLPAIDLYGRAWNHMSDRPDDLDGLRNRLSQMLQHTHLDEEQAGADPWTALKQFCLALHEELMSERIHSRLEDEPSLPGDFAAVLGR